MANAGTLSFCAGGVAGAALEEPAARIVPLRGFVKLPPSERGRHRID
jgi:hypothetical protein